MGGGNPQSRPSDGPSSDQDFVALTKTPGFWVAVRYAALLGVVLGFVALAFLGLLKGGTKLWFTLPKDPGWFDGSLWWVGVTAGAGVLVGALRRFLKVPAEMPGTLKELKDRWVDPTTAPATVLVSLVSLVGGASLGPRTPWGRWAAGSEPGSRAVASSARTCRRRTPSAGWQDPTEASWHHRCCRRCSSSRSCVRGRDVSPTRWSRPCSPPRSRSPSTSRSRDPPSSGSTPCPPTGMRTGSCSPRSRSGWWPGGSR